jgi:hypothetical protein
LAVLVILLDRSASMAYDNKLTRAKELARANVQDLREDDKVCIVSIDHMTEVLLPLCAKKDAQDISGLVEGVRDRGNTNLALGLRKASEVMEGQAGKVVLLSDGRANTTLDGGGTEGDKLVEGEILRVAKDLSERGIAVSAISLGEDSFASVLEGITQVTGGELLVDVEGELRREFDLHETRVIVHSFPGELPGGKPTWAKELNTRHVTVASRELCSRFERSRVSFLLNPESNKQARVSLVPIDDPQLAPFRDREPDIARRVRESSAILVDRTYRRALDLRNGGVALLRIE